VNQRVIMVTEDLDTSDAGEIQVLKPKFQTREKSIFNKLGHEFQRYFIQHFQALVLDVSSSRPFQLPAGVRRAIGKFR